LKLIALWLAAVAGLVSESLSSAPALSDLDVSIIVMCEFGNDRGKYCELTGFWFERSVSENMNRCKTAGL
jgi:hypothetical protein